MGRSVGRQAWRFGRTKVGEALDLAEAEALALETLFELASEQPLLPEEELVRLARNRVLSVMRAEARRGARLGAADPETLALEPSASPESRLERRRRQAWLEAERAGLTWADRRLLDAVLEHSGDLAAVARDLPRCSVWTWRRRWNSLVQRLAAAAQQA
jgi:hypothetical protein